MEQYCAFPFLHSYYNRKFVIIQNILLFAFSSHQIVAFFPAIYDSGKDLLFGKTEIADIVTSAASSVVSSMSEASSSIFSQMAMGMG